MPDEWKTISSDHVINVVYTFFWMKSFRIVFSDNYSKNMINGIWMKNGINI